MAAAGLLDLYIITGTSRGLGAALAEQVLAPATRLLAIARGTNATLDAAAHGRGASVEQWAIDLADAPVAAGRLGGWIAQQPREQVRSATLINNAALSMLGPVEVAGDAELSTLLRVDIEAPILLTAAFLRATRGWPATRRVLQISSGAGRRAFPGMASYCAAKAALDHFARAIALDEQRQGARGARIVSLAPGVIDTDMQAQTRATDPTLFSERQYFVDLQQRGELVTPEAAAARILARLAREDFGTEPVADIRDP